MASLTQNVEVCPVCHSTMRTHLCLRTEMAECKNPTCDIYEVTLEVGAHALLTVEEIAGWKATNARLAVQS